MSIEVLVQLIMSLGVLPALFIFLLVYTLKQHEKDKEESKEREDKLMTHLEKTNVAHEKISVTLEKLEMRMEQIEKRIDREC